MSTLHFVIKPFIYSDQKQGYYQNRAIQPWPLPQGDLTPEEQHQFENKILSATKTLGFNLQSPDPSVPRLKTGNIIASSWFMNEIHYFVKYDKAITKEDLGNIISGFNRVYNRQVEGLYTPSGYKVDLYKITDVFYEVPTDLTLIPLTFPGWI